MRRARLGERALSHQYSEILAGTMKMTLTTTRLAIACLAVAVLSAVGASTAHARDFVNSQPVAIADRGRTDPYPSSIAVAGLGAPATKVTLTLKLEHSFKKDLEVLLVAPQGQKVLVMSDAAGSSASPVTWTFDDAAATALRCDDSKPEPPSGAYRPTNCERFAGDLDSLRAPAPAPPYSATMAAFNGADPNGTWQLYVEDVGSGDDGTLKSWTLSIKAPPPGGGAPPPSPPAREPGGDGGDAPAGTAAPRVRRLRVSPRRFAVRPRRRGGRRVARSTVFRFGLSERSRVVYSIQRKLAGRRAGRRCRAPRRSNRGRRRCVRWRSSGRFAGRGLVGANRRVFRGRIGRRALRPGIYRVRVRATDRAGNRSRIRGARFRIVRGR